MRSRNIQVKRINQMLILVLGFLVIFIFNTIPFFWGIITSLKSTSEIASYPPKFEEKVPAT